MPNQRIQQTKGQFNISESFAELLAHLKNGRIQINMANQSALEIRAENSKIKLNLLTPKNLVEVNDKSKNNDSHAKLSLRKKISEAKDFAYLRNNDLTISMRYEDKEIIILGRKAKPKLSKLIIGSNDIQIKNLRQLKKLDNELFNA